MRLKFSKNGRLVTISTPSGVGVVYAPTTAETAPAIPFIDATTLAVLAENSSD